MADGAAAGVHFVVFNPSSDDFNRGRLAMDGVLPDGTKLPFAPRDRGQGFNSILRTTHRQNFLVPPRRHRSFPLVELLVIRRRRPATPAAVARIYQRVARRGDAVAARSPHDGGARRVVRRRSSAGEAWVFEEDGVPVGYAVMQDDELHDLYVAPEAQRRGVGSALFAHVQAAHPDGFRFWVFRDNTRALAVLRRPRLRGRRRDRGPERGEAARRALRVAA